MPFLALLINRENRSTQQIFTISYNFHHSELFELQFRCGILEMHLIDISIGFERAFLCYGERNRKPLFYVICTFCSIKVTEVSD